MGEADTGQQYPSPLQMFEIQEKDTWTTEFCGGIGMERPVPQEGSTLPSHPSRLLLGTQIQFVKYSLAGKIKQGKGGRKRGRGRSMCERYIHQVSSNTSRTGDLARNPGICPDQETSQQPFCSQAGAQSTEPHQPGLLSFLCVRF
ncbi:hypothetical protein HJG60_010008 [Phyllostomus discolor]|uniref:Uncharacterized protein n=1 Tax=Phyllostomus discolor TaxID=89673 RepID=A0A833Y3Y3_9CHIR|nr:hypothetical protein HJG60_010008 [Phyllostomus discolor]